MGGWDGLTFLNAGLAHLQNESPCTEKTMGGEEVGGTKGPASPSGEAGPPPLLPPLVELTRRSLVRSKRKPWWRGEGMRGGDEGSGSRMRAGTRLTAYPNTLNPEPSLPWTKSMRKKRDAWGRMALQWGACRTCLFPYAQAY